MSRYAWPVAGRGREVEDAPGERGRFLARRRLEFDPGGAQRAARAPQRAPQGVGPLAPADGRQHLWEPLGPQTVIGGQAAGSPRITGRIAALCVHPDGDRIYAASANGGVWYSRDGGANWLSLGGFAPTAAGGIDRPAHRNACGAIEVQFGATEADDVVYVGTGEVTHPFGVTASSWVSGQPGRPLAGIGILRAEHPAAPLRDDPWIREAKNLLGNGVYRIAIQPGGGTVIAATLTGLFQRPSAPGADVDWVRPSGAPFDTLAVECTDVLWTAGAGARPARLWVWVERGPSAGLWVRDDGQPNFRAVATAGSTGRRAVLAASTPPDRVWVFNDRPNGTLPLLFRVNNASAALPVASAVTGIPDVLKTQGFYDIAIAVDPSRPERVALGGSVLSTTTPEGAAVDGNAAIVVADVTAAGAAFTYGSGANPFTMIGVGVHADVHDLKYSNAGARLWTACDGGVFRSDRPTSSVGFFSRSHGIAVVEPNYLGNHPRCEGHVAAGLQDNAVVARVASGVWKLVGLGDGGGVAFDPLRPDRFIRQHFQGFWSSSDGTLTGTEFLTRAGAFVTAEHNVCAFYSMPAGIGHRRGAPPPPAPNVGQILIGTNRLWYSENFGASWVTLPTGTDPLPGNLTQDSFGEAITVCRWQNSDVAWALGEGRLMRYARTPGSDVGGGPGTWSRETVLKKGVKNKKDTTSADGPIRDSAVWTDLAVNLDAGGAQRGTRGAVYLGTIGKEGNTNVDTLWWFDGTSRWFKTGLRTDANGVPAPVTAIVCDPQFPDEVYVGTTVGVWKGVRTQVGNADPAWTWHKRLNGLPEAAVEDLAIFSDGGLRLLRAAVAARGVFELRLDVADLQDQTYLRAHDDDLRLRPQAVGLQRDGVTARSWHGSPDVRPRRAPLACPAPATLPWSASSPGVDAEPLRRFQSALRARTGDLRVRPTGQWEVYFNEVLRDLAAPTVAPATVRIDEAFWNLSMQPPQATAEPWGGVPPTHPDLLDFSAAIEEGVRERTSCELPPGATKVDILVQHRGLAPLDGAGVRVTLLKWIDPRTTGAANWSDSSSWFSGNVPWADAVNQVLNSITGDTTHPLGSGWSFVGNTLAKRRQTLAGQILDALHPGIATFDLDLSGLKRDRVVLLVAVIRSGADVALTADTLEHLAMSNSNVAVRSLRVNGFSVDTGSSLSPFSTRLYPAELAPSPAQNARLATALQTVRAPLSAANKARLDKAALIVVKLTSSGAMDYAGVLENDMFFSASLLKVSLLYATFELVARVNALAPLITASTPVEFFDKVKRDFSGKIERAVPRILPGEWRKVAFDKALSATPVSPGRFRVSMSAQPRPNPRPALPGPWHDADLRSIFAEQRQNDGARDCMHRLGYSYVNRALDAAGFFDLETDKGIWMATDYGNWSDFNVPVSTNGTSSAAMTALAMANLLCHMHRGQLVDPASSLAMRDIFRTGGAWLSTLSNPAAFSFTAEGAKVGHSASGSARVGSVMSEAVFLKRTSDTAPFLAVWQNVPDELGAEPIYQVLDEMIKNWP